MRARGLDADELRAVSPAALAAWARAAGWKKSAAYGEFADIYAAAGLPEIILPRIRELADYPAAAEQLIGYFARAAGADELTVYRDLLETDRDAVRVRAGGGADDERAPTLDNAVALLGGARAMLLAAARSLSAPRPFYRTRADRETADYMKRVRLGPGDGGGSVVLLTPPAPAPPPRPGGAPGREPFERRAAKRLAEALEAVAELPDTNGGDAVALFRLAERGVSANLCEALADMADPFPTLDIAVIWARAGADAPAPARFRFSRGDAFFLRDAAQLFRDSDAR